MTLTIEHGLYIIKMNVRARHLRSKSLRSRVIVRTMSISIVDLCSA